MSDKRVKEIGPFLYGNGHSRVQWLIPIVLALHEVEAGRWIEATVQHSEIRFQNIVNGVIDKRCLLVFFRSA